MKAEEAIPSFPTLISSLCSNAESKARAKCWYLFGTKKNTVHPSGVKWNRGWEERKAMQSDTFPG